MRANADLLELTAKVEADVFFAIHEIPYLASELFRFGPR
jgi:hypothetical protein